MRRSVKKGRDICDLQDDLYDLGNKYYEIGKFNW